jgi:hypothetical protein
LQGRVIPLNLDLIRTKEALDNCAINPDCEWNHLGTPFPINDDEYLSETTIKNGNLYYQKQIVRFEINPYNHNH